jgi:hypothetical protein
MFLRYKDIGDWIKQEVEKESFKDILAHEKIMRTLVKKGELQRLSNGLFVY